MDTEEKKQWYALKDKAAKELKALVDDHDMKAFDGTPVWKLLIDTDGRIVDYILSVCNDPEAHNLYEILGITRSIKMLTKYAWNRKKIRKFFKFYEHLKFDGANGRQCYRLTPVQAFQFANVFGFQDANGRRLCRNFYLFVPRKFGKTTSVASLAIYDLFFGDNNAEVYVGANSYRQAKICFTEIQGIIQAIDPSCRHFKVNRELIKWLAPGHESFIECLAANARTRDGLKASTVIIDEYSQARDTANKPGAKLKNTLTSSMGTRKEPLTVVITTASEVIDGPFKHELDGVMRMLRGEMEDDRMFASLFMPDPDDEDGDPRTWRKVQPHIGVTIQPDYYENEWKTAQLSEENMLNFRTKMLNVFTVNTARTWMDYDKASDLLDKGGSPLETALQAPAPDRGTPRLDCAIAFDLSVHDDFSAVSYTIWSRTDKKFYTHTDYYFPEGALKGHPNETIYRQWHEQGYLNFCKGDIIDMRQIASDIINNAKKLHVIRVGFDAYKSRELVNILSSAGFRGVLMPYSQTYGSFNLPVEAFELLAWGDPVGIVLNNNPINAYCLCNCVIDEDRLENKKPIKISQFRKIDGAITLLMTLGLMSAYER